MSVASLTTYGMAQSSTQMHRNVTEPDVLESRSTIAQGQVDLHCQVSNSTATCIDMYCPICQISNLNVVASE
jgi:hypothetical protein